MKDLNKLIKKNIKEI